MLRRTGAIVALAACSMAWGQGPVHSAVPHPGWTGLLKRASGWTGGDGIFAIPLSGHEGPGRASEGKTLFIFSDTFVGNVDATGRRTGATMINNSLAVLQGDQPDSSKLRFLWGRNAQDRPAAVFVPNTPKTRAILDTGGRVWYWPQDGFVHKGHFYNLPLVVQHDPAGREGFQFAEIGIALIKVPLNAFGEPDLAKQVQVDAPLYHRPAGGRALYYGCGILVNTAEAGAPDPDGYVYVYGRNSLYVSRVLADEFEDFSRWRFWDGVGWNADIAKSASLGLGGPELSVMPIPDGSLKGKYVLVTSGIEPNIFMRVGESPKGPFGNRINVFRASEWDTAAPIYVYNAKAHPSLSRNGDWLVTYNVNTSNWDLNLAQADIYRPRFFTLRFDANSSLARPGIPLLRARRGGWEFSGRGMPVLRAGPGAGGARGQTLRLDGRQAVAPRAIRP